MTLISWAEMAQEVNASHACRFCKVAELFHHLLIMDYIHTSFHNVITLYYVPGISWIAWLKAVYCRSIPTSRNQVQSDLLGSLHITSWSHMKPYCWNTIDSYRSIHLLAKLCLVYPSPANHSLCQIRPILKPGLGLDWGFCDMFRCTAGDANLQLEIKCFRFQQDWYNFSCISVSFYHPSKKARPTSSAWNVLRELKFNTGYKITKVPLSKS